MKKSILLLSGLLFLITFAAFGQANIGIEAKAGLNIAMLSNSKNVEEEPMPTFGWQVGSLLTFYAPQGVGFETGLLYTTKGYTFRSRSSYDGCVRGYEEDNTYHTHSYLELPAHFVYRSPKAKVKFLIRAGLYTAVAVSGRISRERKSDGSTWDRESQQLTIATGDNGDLHPFDMGFNIGVGIEVHRFTAGLQYGNGLVNVLPDHIMGNTHNQVLSLTLGYRVLNIEAPKKPPIEVESQPLIDPAPEGEPPLEE